MSIHVECSECSRPYDVPDRYAGQKVRCKSCGAAIPIPNGAFPNSAIPVTAARHGGQPSLLPAKRSTRPAASRGTAAANGGVMWWLIGGAAAFALALLAISFLTPLGILIGIGLFVVGMLILTVGQVFLIVTAFQEDATQGLLVFFVPIYPLFYLFSRWPKTSTSVWLYGAGAVAALLAVPAGFGGLFATARWANDVQVAGNAAAQDAPAAREFDEFVPPEFPQPGGFPQSDAFPPPGFPPAGFPPPGEMPPGFPPPMERPAVFPAGLPPEMQPPGERELVAGSAEATSDDPATLTFYLRSTNSFFDRTVDLKVAADEQLSEIDGYVPGSVNFDLEEGQVTLEAPRDRGVVIRINHVLFRLGLIAHDRPSQMPWLDPTQPRTVTLTIRSTSPAFDDLDDVDSAVDGLLSEIDGYVTGSVDVDVDAHRVTYDAYPGSKAERYATPALLRAGINAIATR